MEIEKVNDKWYVTETYTVAELGYGVISKGQAFRYFKDKHPEYKAIALTNFKVLHDIASIRIVVQVTKKESQPIDKVKGQKLLNPGYDELKEKYDALVIAHEKLLGYCKKTDAILAAYTREELNKGAEIIYSPEGESDEAA